MCQILTKQPWKCDYLCSLKKQIIKSMTLQKNPCCVSSGFHISVILLGVLKGENQKWKNWEKGFEMYDWLLVVQEILGDWWVLDQSFHLHEIISQDGHKAMWWLFPASGELCDSFTIRTEIPTGSYAPFRLIADIDSIFLNKIRTPEFG